MTKKQSFSKPFVDVDGVRYISTEQARKIYSLSVSAWHKKRLATDIHGRRLTQTNALYYTLDEAEKIATKSMYRSTPTTKNSQHLRLILSALDRIANRLEKVANTGDFHFNSECSRILDGIDQARKHAETAKAMAEATEPPTALKKRGRKPKNL